MINERILCDLYGMAVLIGIIIIYGCTEISCQKRLGKALASNQRVYYNRFEKKEEGCREGGWLWHIF